jgi:hypothetical protein
VRKLQAAGWDSDPHSIPAILDRAFKVEL